MTYTYKYKQMRQAILKRDDHTCAYCGQPGNQIDHIIPISSGKTEDEVIKLCHYSNLQPLWAEENLLKSDKI